MAPLWAARRSLIAAISMGLYFFLFKPFLPPIGTNSLIFSLFLDVGAGAFIYFTVIYLTWIIEKKPPGIEKSVLATIQNR